MAHEWGDMDEGVTGVGCCVGVEGPAMSGVSLLERGRFHVRLTYVNRTIGSMMGMVVILALLVACGRTPPDRGVQARSASTASPDPIIAALRHVRSLEPEVWPIDDGQVQDLILVHHAFAERVHPLGGRRLHGEIGGGTWVVPEDAYADLRRRHAAAVPYPQEWPEWVRVVDVGELAGRFLHFETRKRYPRARCYLVLGPVGMNAIGDRAVVQADFGPTPHGATIVLLLERTDDRWRVVECCRLYFA